MTVNPQRIRQARLKAGFTQESLAHAANTTVRNIARWEGGHHEPRAEHVAAIAKATGVSIASLHDQDDEEEIERAQEVLYEALSNLVHVYVVRERQRARENPGERLHAA